jgi:replicative DNA helicase
MRRLPQNLEAERELLGAMLLDNQAIDDVALVVKPEDFYTDEHQTLCRAIFDLRNEGKPATPVTLMDLLSRLSRDKHGFELIESLMGSTCSAANAAHHAVIVREKAIKRELIAACELVAIECYKDSETAASLTDQAEAAIFAVAEREDEGGTVEAVVAVDEAIARTDLRATTECTGITTGIRELDKMMDGFQPGQLIVLAARPSVGKTALAINICDHIVLDRHGSAQFFSMEMPKKEIGDRLICSRAQIDGYKLRTSKNLTPYERGEMRKVRAAIAQEQFGIDDNAHRTVGQIAASIRRRIRRNGAIFAALDYIQLIDAQPGRGESRQEQVSKISRRLKILARQCSIPILALSQLNRSSESRDDKRPRLSDLRESGAIEQDADIVLLLHRPDVYDPKDNPKDKSARKAEIIVAKNRNGPTGTIEVDFFRQFAKFANVGEIHVDNPDFGPTPNQRQPEHDKSF